MPAFWHERTKICGVCVKNEVSISALLSEELDRHSDDGMELENEKETANEQSSKEMYKRERESGTRVVLTDWVGRSDSATRNPRHTHLLKMESP